MLGMEYSCEGVNNSKVAIFRVVYVDVNSLCIVFFSEEEGFSKFDGFFYIKLILIIFYDFYIALSIDRNDRVAVCLLLPC